MVNIPKFFKNQEGGTAPEVLPLLPLRDIVVFPHMVAPLLSGATNPSARFPAP
jgi:ATP-dependent Lon protease